MFVARGVEMPAIDLRLLAHQEIQAQLNSVEGPAVPATPGSDEVGSG